jgi:hypothetical protein
VVAIEKLPGQAPMVGLHKNVVNPRM